MEDLLISPNVVKLSSDKQKNVVDSDPYQNSVAYTIKWFVFIAIYLNIIRRSSHERILKLTCEDIMLLVWTAMLYNDEPTVRVLTVPEFRLVSATEEFS